VFFHDGLEVLRGGGLQLVALHKVLHGGLEPAVPILGRPHHHADHVQDIRALGINQIIVDVPSSFGRAEPSTHRYRAYVDRPEAFRILFREQLVLLMPKFEEFARLPAWIAKRWWPKYRQSLRSSIGRDSCGNPPSAPTTGATLRAA
jgi:hypothetical protein